MATLLLSCSHSEEHDGVPVAQTEKYGAVAIVAVLKVRDALVPIVAFQAPEIRSRNKASCGGRFELSLECESLIALLVGFRLATIDKE